jgi:hypothetical protein
MEKYNGSSMTFFFVVFCAKFNGMIMNMIINVDELSPTNLIREAASQTQQHEIPQAVSHEC